MKIRLTPELSYIIGLWKTLRTKDGIGIQGDQKVLDLFTKLVIDQKLIEPNKIQMGKDKVYFYHTQYKKFLNKIIDSELEKFRYINDYSGNFVAGMFDASGRITEKGIVIIRGLNRLDEVLLMRLGFMTERRNDNVVMMKPLIFLRFIQPYLKLTKLPPNINTKKKRRKKKEIVKNKNKNVIGNAIKDNV